MNRREIADRLRAEASGEDLMEGPCDIHVYAKRKDGSLYELGSVSKSLVYIDPDGAKEMIERIKFKSTKRG